MTLTKANKPTLFKAVEAAKNDLRECVGGYYQRQLDANNVVKAAEKALAALPDKPMTEVQIFDLIDDAAKITLEGETIHEIIRALKAADVLYVKED